MDEELKKVEEALRKSVEALGNAHFDWRSSLVEALREEEAVRRVVEQSLSHALREADRALSVVREALHDKARMQVEVTTVTGDVLWSQTWWVMPSMNPKLSDAAGAGPNQVLVLKPARE